jgi:ATP/maltotriose-dependent transcriptional regulator MalT
MVLGSLVNGLASLDQHVVLILDDYHLVDAPGHVFHGTASVHAGLGFLLDHRVRPACTSSSVRASILRSRLRGCARVANWSSCTRPN